MEWMDVVEKEIRMFLIIYNLINQNINQWYEGFY